MTFNDDEPIVVVPDNSGKPTLPERGRVKETTISKKEAPLEETNFKALVKLEGERSYSDRPGVDIVTVLDVSGSMGDDQKLEKLKTAMQFVIRKLSSVDRLSVVTFANRSSRLCPLRQITNDSQSDIEKIVKGLVANGGTNITAGLQIALQVLNDRRLSEGRVSAIMLMSDGVQNDGGDARNVAVGNVPVYTFGFGKDYDSAVLNGIANNSNGGTFSIADVDNLSVAFAQCLAGLLTVVVQDLKVTIKPLTVNAGTETIAHKIQTVFAGNYPQTKDEASGSVTVSFGDLYVKEIRKIIVELILPAVEKRVATRSFQVSIQYSVGGRLIAGSPKTVSVTRSGTATEQEPEELVLEDKRLETTRMMKQARDLADGDKLDDAKEKLVDTQSMLEDVEVEEEPNQQTLDVLKTQVQTLKKFMRSPEVYKTLGRAFALACETSHNRQRFASLGEDENLRLFTTPRMDAYLEQAKAFDEEPEKPIPSADDDVKEEIEKDPVGPIASSLSFYLQTAIEALQAMQEILNAGS